MTSRIDRLRGFTLVELLIVIVIIAVIMTMIGPSFTAGSDVARVKTASRGVMQMSRYARTMALLHQTPLELVFTSDGKLSVSPGGGGGESVVSAKAFAVTNAAVAAEERGEAEAASAEAAAEKEAKVSGGGGGGGAAYVMADLAIEKTFEQVTFVFEGYTDSLDDGRSGKAETVSSAQEEPSDANGETVQVFRVHYKSNGTCRPYKVKITCGTDAAFSITVVIDMLGSAKIEEDE